MNRTILIVDDDVIAQNILSAIVSRLGCTPQVCQDGFEAIQYLRQHAEGAAAVLLDIYMPGVDGISMMGHLSRNHPDLPVIVVSGSEDPTDMNAVIKLGAVGFLQKPLPLDTAEDALRSILEKVL